MNSLHPKVVIIGVGSTYAFAFMTTVLVTKIVEVFEDMRQREIRKIAEMK